MDAIPWYAWIVLLAIAMGGLVQVVRLISSRDTADHIDPDLRARVISLEQRIDRLERR
ncbi:hypothetical protein [Ornithinicoccus hortensis]|uniref:Uncharacterized protein n=1 Tax=Ornithinicoccus hortensis TaxID=82346 RepID=A0A542YWI4_9MICO|nr:hypothetical protein [Ornithinicoccus hortensis]TQL52445.1 hypothetical protein FB467_3631 [Ornithinicoccus hortensis]